MIKGIGVDIVEVERIAKAAENERFYTRLFTSAEVAVFERCHYRAETVAGRFAAKEAVLKALGCGIGDVAFADIAVLRADSGAPYIELSGSAQAKAAALGIKTIHISISHTARYAVAQAVAEGD